MTEASDPIISTERSGSRNLQLQWGVRSDRGLRREQNEDAVFAAEPLFAVADGMGGYEAGDVASRICLEVLASSTEAGSISAASLDDALQRADTRIRERTGARAGTTLAGVALVEEAGNSYWLVFNVGDSRTYLLSQGHLQRVSVDHSEVQEMLEAGALTSEEARAHPRRNVITRALGLGENGQADYWMLPAQEGDRVLVCSDGLSSEVTDEAILEILARVEDAQPAADALLQAALDNGGRDNVSLVVINAGRTMHSGPVALSEFPELDDSTIEVAIPGGNGGGKL